MEVSCADCTVFDDVSNTLIHQTSLKPFWYSPPEQWQNPSPGYVLDSRIYMCTIWYSGSSGTVAGTPS